MKIEKLNIPAAGTWARDCELVNLTQHNGLKINYHKDEDDSNWTIECQNIVVYKITNEEFSRSEYLKNLPVEGAFFEILDSPWIHELGGKENRILCKCKHYIFQFYDETIEVVAQNFIFRRLEI